MLLALTLVPLLAFQQAEVQEPEPPPFVSQVPS